MAILLIIVICLLVAIIVGLLARLVLHCLKKRCMKKGMAAESLGSIANVCKVRVRVHLSERTMTNQDGCDQQIRDQ